MMAAWMPCEICHQYSVRIDPADPPRQVRCPGCAAHHRWPEEEQRAYEWIVQWFFARYEDPVENCPCDSGEYVYIAGGPYLASDEIREAWGRVIKKRVLKRVLKRFDAEYPTLEWSGVLGDEQDMAPIDDLDDEQE